MFKMQLQVFSMLWLALKQADEVFAFYHVFDRRPG